MVHYSQHILKLKVMKEFLCYDLYFFVLSANGGKNWVGKNKMMHCMFTKSEVILDEGWITIILLSSMFHYKHKNGYNYRYSVIKAQSISFEFPYIIIGKSENKKPFWSTISEFSFQVI